MTGAEGLELIAASAGSGKTHRLTEVVTAAVDPKSATAIALEGLVAVTYTRRAAAELEARIRRRLVASGAHERAHELPLARVGTVHAVCLRLLSQFALEAGISPELSVLTGNATGALRQALEDGLDRRLREQLEGLAAELELGWDERTRRSDWARPVEEIMALARGNRIAPTELPGMAERSARRLLQLLGPAERDGEALDRELAAELGAAEAALACIDDHQKNTARVREVIRKAKSDLARGQLRWSRWIALQKLEPGKSARSAVAALTEVASRVDHHPRLHAQLRELTLATYAAAASGLEAYASWKRQRRLVDFTDMVDRALSLVALPDVRLELSGQLELVVVDEFQDTSPVQLALFMKLHELAGRSTWVGDRKQCIFEYAGADPTLMDAIARWVPAAGGKTDALPDNRRSRPELVELCSRLFARALAAQGYAAAEVEMAARREALPELAGLPPSGVFWMHGKSRDADASAIAEGVERLLRDPDATPVLDRQTHQVRRLRAADVAVLVATNDEAGRLTLALSRRGIRTSIAQSGLLDTPEGTLVEAALGVLVDARGGRERAVVEALTGFGGAVPDGWLASAIEERRRRREARERGEQLEPAPMTLPMQRLESLRATVELLAPSEVLDHVLEALELPELCSRWPDPEQRRGNLDALRALGARYEARAAQQREAASVAGLLRYFQEARRRIRVGDEELASDDQHVSLGAHGVTVVTYHRSKGLEWPVVILGSLDRSERRDAFDVGPESDRAEFDPEEPLGGRWIRYFPWPFGSQRTAPLEQKATASPEGAAVRAREARERLRLLYVGFTRARDHLILAVRSGRRGPKADWLEELRDPSGEFLLSLPLATPPDEKETAQLAIRGQGAQHFALPARVWSFSEAEEPWIGSPPEPPRWFARGEPLPERRVPHHIAPSQAGEQWPELALGAVGEARSTGSRLPLGSDKLKDWRIVGDTLHAFLAADLPELTEERRLVVARRRLAASKLGVLLQPEALLRAGDQLRRWIDSQWPGAVWHRELPVSGLIRTEGGTRRIEGVIDLLLETSTGVVLIDHKSYPGQRHTWREKAREYVAQLAAYAEVLKMAGKVVVSQWISFPMVGGVVELHDASLLQLSRGEAVVSAGRKH